MFQARKVFTRKTCDYAGQPHNGRYLSRQSPEIPVVTTVATHAISEPFFCHLPNTGLLLVEGPDAAKFLQGQITCDIRELTDQKVLLGAQCSPKGRVLLNFYAVQLQPDTIALRLPRNILEQAQISLGKYIVFSKAKLRKADDAYAIIGLHSSRLDDFSNILGTIPHEPLTWIDTPQGIIWRLDETHMELWLKSPTALAPLGQSLAEVASLRTENDWNLAQIQRGITCITPETYEQFTPQELNLTLVNGVNFRKGCYTGQEIVARLHYRGHAKRHTYRYHLTSPQAPVPGSLIVNSAGVNIGHIINIASSGNNQFELLACVTDEHINEAQLRETGEKLQQLPLPYAIPSADDKTNAE